MRLLHIKDLKLVEFVGPQIPKYAILSHTWDDEEITYEEMTAQHPESRSKKGFSKILGACRQALKDSLLYVWIDTCCIDKKSSAELSEAINSMYEWYQKAEVCYAFLSDVLETPDPYRSLYASTLQPDAGEAMRGSQSLTKSRWFTRGWTLQELLAPKHVVFYDSTWKRRGTRHEIAESISTHTSIPLDVLRSPASIKYCSVAMKMSWAAYRRTTRTEDLAYCLLGIFDVNMALLYGEGRKAFRRLQDEIVKHKNDLTIFAWNPLFPSEMDGLLLAPSASNFYRLSISPSLEENIDFTITNKGIRISDEKFMWIARVQPPDNDSRVVTYVFPLGESNRRLGGVCLRKIGPKIYSRDCRCPLVGFDGMQYEIIRTFYEKDYYILTDLEPPRHRLEAFCRNGMLRVIPNPAWDVIKTSPELSWDETDQSFLKTDAMDFRLGSAIRFVHFRSKFGPSIIRIVAVCTYEQAKTPVVRIFAVDASKSHLLEFIFNSKYQYEGVDMERLKANGFELPNLSSTILIKLNNQVTHVSVAVQLLRKSRDNNEIENVYELSLETK